MDELRKHTRTLYEKYFNDEKSLRIEVSVWNQGLSELLDDKHPEFRDYYIKRNMSILENLRTSQQLRSDIENDVIPAGNVGSMDYDELNCYAWEEIKRRHRENEEKDKNILSSLQTTDVYECKRCRQNKCVYTEAQTRSADEPMTKFITCVVCNNKWKC
jgi:hypothetical protein